MLCPILLLAGVVAAASADSSPARAVADPNVYTTNSNCTYDYRRCGSVSIFVSAAEIRVYPSENHDLPAITKRAAAFFDGLTYFFGGDDERPTARVDYIDDESTRAAPLAEQLPAPVKLPRAAVFTAHNHTVAVVIAGGLLDGSNASDMVWSFAGAEFHAIDYLPVTRVHHTLTATKCGLLLIGGDTVLNGYGTDDVFVLRDIASAWEPLPPAPVTLTKHAAVAKTVSVVLVCGGWQTGIKTSMCYYVNACTGAWMMDDVERMLVPRAGHSILKAHGAQVFYMIGDDENVGIIEKYVPGVSSTAVRQTFYANSYFAIAPLPVQIQ